VGVLDPLGRGEVRREDICGVIFLPIGTRAKDVTLRLDLSLELMSDLLFL
jgi:hypothetical protein